MQKKPTQSFEGIQTKSINGTAKKKKHDVARYV